MEKNKCTDKLIKRKLVPFSFIFQSNDFWKEFARMDEKLTSIIRIDVYNIAWYNKH